MRANAVFRPAEFRYAAVLAGTLVVVVFLIIAPAADWSHALAFALQSMALVVVVATSRTRVEVRRVRTAVGALAATVWVVLVAGGVVPVWLVFLAGGAISIAIPLALLGGLVRLVRARGVTLQAVAGSLAIYLCIGLAFAWIVGFVARVGSQPYFANGSNGDEGSWVYYSFTVMTTTGFGDYTAAHPVGHALAVVEMLAGQLYLVTVIGVLVGSFGRRSRPS